MAGEDGATDRAGASGGIGNGHRERGRLHGGVRNGKETGENEQLSQAEHLGEWKIMRQSCRDSGTLSQARLKYKWEFSLSRIEAILVNEKKRG